VPLPTPLLRLFLRLRPYALPALILIALWLPDFNRGWYRTDTHYYAAIAKQAADSAFEQRSIVPLLELHAGDQLYLNKPPLVFIIEGLTIKLFGLDIWTVRLPALVAAILLCITTVAITRRLAGARVALTTGLVVATTVEIFRYTRAFSLDLWLVFFLLWGIWFVVREIRPLELRATSTGVEKDKPRSPHGSAFTHANPTGTSRNPLRRSHWQAALAGIPFGLALLCKPWAALAVVLFLAIWLACLGRSKRALILPTLASGLLAIVIALPWHLWIASRHPEFWNVFFRKQSLDRVTGALGPEWSHEPWWYYLGVIAEGYWPWLATLVLALSWLVLARLKPNTFGAHLRSADRRLLAPFALVWSALWVILLSISAGKSSRYLMPVWPMLAMLSGLWLARLPSAPGPRRSRLFMLWAGPLALIVGLIAMALIPPNKVHAPRDPVWERVLAELDAHPDLPVYTTPAAHPISANLVMLGRRWPRTIKDGQWPKEPALVLSLTPKIETLPDAVGLVDSTEICLLQSRP
jgi:4-amino-4-deoxy-L-arabinose transferase-like glycosyltransferase